MGAGSYEYYKTKLPRKRAMHNKKMLIRKPKPIPFNNLSALSLEMGMFNLLIDDIGMFLKNIKKGRLPPMPPHSKEGSPAKDCTK